MSETKILGTTPPLQTAKELSELKKKELELKNYRLNQQYEEMRQNQDELKALQELDITKMSPEYMKKLVHKSADYLAGSKKRSEFIMGIKTFNEFVPYFPKNLILIGAVTGEGKSTCCANLAYTSLLSGNKVLVITNEESAEDVYNRVAAMFLGIRYGNHDRMTDEQINKLHELMPKLAERLRVIDDAWGKMHGYEIESTTTSIEGLDFILKQLIQKQDEGFSFDLIIVDYFQNFSESKKAPGLDPVKVLTKVSSKFDQFKNHYNAPIVLFAQLKANTKEDGQTSAKERIEWCKGIVNKATCFLEMKAIKKDSSTMWIIHKSRWNDYADSAFVTGWEKGRYVEYSEDFKKRIADQKLARLEKKESPDGTSST